VAAALDAFDDAVFRGGVDDQPVAELLHRLMVSRVDLQGFPTDDFPQLPVSLIAPRSCSTAPAI
jgi:hypothetical protein